MSLTSELTESIKGHIKETVDCERERKKDELLNRLRHLSENDEQSSPKSISDLVNNLKKHGSEGKSKILADLKVSFCEDVSSRIEFLKIEGGLHNLVGLILGKDPFIQLLALECCCNLSLGDSKTCYQVAKAGTPYFISILRSLNYTLIGTTLLTIGNLCNGNIKTCHLLLKQGVLAILIELTGIDQVRENAFTALLMLTRSAIGHLRDDEVSRIAEAAMVHYNKEVCAQWLVVEVAHRCPDLLCNLSAANSSVDLFVASASPEVTSVSVQSATAAVRLIANLALYSPAAIQILSRSEELNSKTEAYLHSEYRHLGKETLWMFANIVSNSSLLSNFKEIETSLFSLIRIAALQTSLQLE